MHSSNLRQVFPGSAFGLPGIVMFGRYRHAASRAGLEPHAHEKAIEICFLERGEQTYQVGGRVHRLRGQDQFFTRPGEVHDTARLPQERGILYWLILRLEARRGWLGLDAAAAGRLRRELRAMPARQFRAHPDCSRILGEMTALLLAGRRLRGGGKTSSGARPARLQALLLEYLTRTVEASSRQAPGGASPLMGRVLRYIGARLDEPIQVARLAEVARLSESRLKSRFRREIGVPPAEYWLRQKIERARTLLRTRSVTRTAHELGFSSSQYFATAFKRYTLASPSACAVSRRRGG